MKIKVPIHIVFYKEQGSVIAHCLQFDLVGDGATKEEALECLKEAIITQVEAIQEGETLADSLFFPADPKLFEMFSRGTDTGRGIVELVKINSDELEFDSLSREYDGDMVPA